MKVIWGHLGCPLSGGCPLFGGSTVGDHALLVIEKLKNLTHFDLSYNTNLLMCWYESIKTIRTRHISLLLLLLSPLLHLLFEKGFTAVSSRLHLPLALPVCLARVDDVSVVVVRYARSVRNRHIQRDGLWLQVVIPVNGETLQLTGEN